jgi:signal transduction histidine kinase
MGIPPDQQERVFEVFARLHPQADFPGTGLGLSTVRKAAHLMGGEITLRSAVGEGSTFRLALPAA